MTVRGVSPDAEDKTISMGDTDAPGIEEKVTDQRVYQSSDVATSHQTRLLERLDNMTDDNQVVWATSP